MILFNTYVLSQLSSHEDVPLFYFLYFIFFSLSYMNSFSHRSHIVCVLVCILYFTVYTQVLNTHPSLHVQEPRAPQETPRIPVVSIQLADTSIPVPDHAAVAGWPRPPGVPLLQLRPTCRQRHAVSTFPSP